MRKLIVAFFIITASAPAQVRLSSLNQTLDLAHQKNRDLLIANEKMKIDAMATFFSLAPLLPQVKMISAFDYNFALPTQLIPAEFLGGPAGTYKPVQFGTAYNFSAGFESSIPVLNSSLWIDQSMARISAELGKVNFDYASLEIDKVIAKLYYLTLIAQKAVKIAEHNYSIADSMYQFTLLKSTNGMVEQLDLNRLQNAALSTKNNLEQNKLIFEKNILSLRQLLTIDQKTELIITDTLPASTTADNGITKSTDLFPTVKMKYLQLEQSKKQLRKDKLRYIPEISLYARYQAQAQRRSFDFFESGQSWYAIGSTGFRFDWPLFTGMGRNNNVKRSKARLLMANLEYENEKQKTENDNLETEMNYQTALTVYENSSQSLTLGNQNISIALEKYKEGSFDLNQYLSVYNEALIMQNNWLKAYADYMIWQSVIEIKNK